MYKNSASLAPILPPLPRQGGLLVHALAWRGPPSTRQPLAIGPKGKVDMSSRRWHTTCLLQANAPPPASLWPPLPTVSQHRHVPSLMQDPIQQRQRQQQQRQQQQQQQRRQQHNNNNEGHNLSHLPTPRNAYRATPFPSPCHSDATKGSHQMGLEIIKRCFGITTTRVVFLLLRRRRRREKPDGEENMHSS